MPPSPDSVCLTSSEPSWTQGSAGSPACAVHSLRSRSGTWTQTCDIKFIEWKLGVNGAPRIFVWAYRKASRQTGLKKIMGLCRGGPETGLISSLSTRALGRTMKFRDKASSTRGELTS